MDNSFDREAKSFYEEEFKICSTWNSQRNQVFHRRVQSKTYFQLDYQRNPGIFCRRALLKLPGFKQIIQTRINTSTPTNSEYSLSKPLVPEGLLSPRHPREPHGCQGQGCAGALCTYPVHSKQPLLTPQIFQKPLMESELVTEKEVAMIFVNWKELIMCNIKLLK